MKPTLLIFLKAPVPGHVKTRLAAGIGPEEAALAYRRMAEEIRRAAATLRGTRTVWVYAPRRPYPDPEWLAPGAQWWPQGSGDLGARLRRAFARAFREGRGPVCVIGTDSPWLRAGALRSAFRALETKDMVVGPAEDGGYYLLGLRRHKRELLLGIPWSTPRTLAATLKSAGDLRLRVHLITRGYDVDDLRGWRRWIRGRRRP